MIPIYAFLVFTSILFCLGLYGVMTKRNAVRVLMGIELMFNAAIVNFVVFSVYGSINYTSNVIFNNTGQVIAILSIALAAADAAVGLALLLVLYRNWQKIDVSEMELLKG